MNGTTHVEIIHSRQLHSFVHDTLSGKCGISVQQNGNHVAPIFRPIATVKLPRPSLSCHHRIHTLQMRWIRHKTEMNFSSIRVCPVHARSKMILDVSGNAPVFVGFCVGRKVVVSALEFGKDEWHGFSHHVGENIETTTMRHANDEGVGTKFRGAINGVLEGGNNGFATIQAKPFGGVEFVGQKRLKGIGKTKSFKNVLLLLFIIRHPSGLFDPFSNPIALVWISNVHVFDSQRPTVGFPQGVQDGTECDFARKRGQFFQIALVPSRGRSLEIHGAIQVLDGIKPKMCQSQLGRKPIRIDGPQIGRTRWKRIFAMQPQWIQIGGRMPIHLIGPNQM
mmetsp:Transcript_24526/g.44358  ORF Transcript_24526/g.44358 Transcript_24526/m.44358 type:complete len:336 (-) Transcript_24526:558-1565(-)